MTDESSSQAGRVVVVTGCASGIGMATARALLAEGITVVGVDLESPQAELSAHPSLDWITGDVASAETWERATAAARRHDPQGASALLSCAADVVVASFLETDLEEWRRLFDVNVLGVLRGMHALMPAMIERGTGAVAVVCSVNSLYAEDALSAYSASKAALLHVVRSAALECSRDGVRVNAVCPGAVDTPMFRRALDSMDDPEAAWRAVERRTPAGKVLRPEEVANVLLFLISDAASGLAGAAVTVDGGLTTTYDFDSSVDR
jgi:NAD(P)-dependent dehydrogenase (short-subunit alcohol dehydrogenase family)